MRYIGCKTLMLQNILRVIRENTENVNIVTDIFCGTGTVAKAFKNEGYKVNANDSLYFSYVLNKGILESMFPPKKELAEAIKYLNNLSLENSPWFDLENAFIYQNYSRHESCERMYFQNDNAIKIDLIRQEIERQRNSLVESDYFYLLASLISAVPYISNITGTYGAYLKTWDKRTYNKLELKELELIPGNTECHCYNMEALDIGRQIKSDLVYLDPPYNGRQYLSNYHLLETIARYDYPQIRGVTGMRIDPSKMSDFCKKSKVKNAFENLLEALDCKYILLSYNNEGILKTEEMTQIIKNAGIKETFRFYEFDYRRYKNKIPNNKEGLKEQLYFIQKIR